MLQTFVLATGIVAAMLGGVPAAPGPDRAELHRCFRIALDACAADEAGACMPAAVGLCNRMIGDPTEARRREGANLRLRVLPSAFRPAWSRPAD